MLIREVVYQDYPQIKKLAKKHKLEIYEQSDWESIWKNNPYLNENKIKWPPGWVLEVNGIIVGHVGNIPVEYYYKSKPYIGSVISCWVVEKKYRYLSIKLLQKFNSQKNLHFSIGTTANIKTGKALNFFGWKKNPMQKYNDKLYIVLNLKNILKSYFKKKKIYTNNFLTYLFYLICSCFFFKKLNHWKKIKTYKEIVVYNSFNEKFDLFWNQLKQSNKDIFMFNRSKKWMNWHLNYHLKNNNAWIIAEEVNNKKKQGYLDNSILKGEGTLIGFFGEYYWDRYLGEISRSISTDPNADYYNHDLLIGEKYKCEIKTKQRNKKTVNDDILYNDYEASVAKPSEHQTPHFYGFANVEFAEEDNKKIYLNQQITLVGWISYKEFWRICRLKNKGETTGSNKMKVRETMYNVSHNQLKSIKTLIKELELE